MLGRRAGTTTGAPHPDDTGTPARAVVPLRAGLTGGPTPQGPVSCPCCRHHGPSQMILCHLSFFSMAWDLPGSCPHQPQSLPNGCYCRPQCLPDNQSGWVPAACSHLQLKQRDHSHDPLLPSQLVSKCWEHSAGHSACLIAVHSGHRHSPIAAAAVACNPAGGPSLGGCLLLLVADARRQPVNHLLDQSCLHGTWSDALSHAQGASSTRLLPGVAGQSTGRRFPARRSSRCPR